MVLQKTLKQMKNGFDARSVTCGFTIRALRTIVYWMMEVFLWKIV